jgi:hypothetical protein
MDLPMRAARRYARFATKMKWPDTGADEGVLSAWRLAVDVVGRPLDSSWRMAAVGISTSGTWAMPAGVVG